MIDVKKYILETYPEEEGIMIMDGFDDAFLEVKCGPNGKLIAYYDKESILDILINRDRMDYEKAIEYFEFNIAGAYVGEQTPIIVEDCYDQES